MMNEIYTYDGKAYEVIQKIEKFELGVCRETRTEAARFAVFVDGKLRVGPIVRAGNVPRRVFFGKLWGGLHFGFEYTDRHEDDGRYQVWSL